MKYASTILSSAALISTALSATIPLGLAKQSYTTLTPSGSVPSGALTDHSKEFGISLETVSAAKSKRAVNQIGDGQIQHQTSKAAKSEAPKSTASAVNQIGDGQIQHQTAAPKSTASAVNQIGDGQIQHQTAAAKTTASAANQIGDGQIQHQTAAAQSTAPAGNATSATHPSTASGASQVTDGQIQNSNSTSSKGDSKGDSKSSGTTESCKGSNTLTMKLKNSVLTDLKGRVGSIVANHQFQFDGPPPQAGAIYAAGWYVKDGYLGLGKNSSFYQCHSGDFYNLYDKKIGDQCSEVKLSVIDFVDC